MGRPKKIPAGSTYPDAGSLVYVAAILALDQGIDCVWDEDPHGAETL